jgi:tetratricopeptide (TPR) repeat protein
MSPEQVLAKRVPIDHRTDVYSLGATLYELLTLRPPFDGDDRQELLRQVAFEEPITPRRLNRAVPRELETIVLKAMEKNPTERYATAQVLADDLRRFLRDEPIQARRPTLVQIAAKWSRRHRTLVWSTAALFLVAVALSVGGAWWAQQQQLKYDAEQARQETERVRQEAEMTRAVEDGFHAIAREQQQPRPDWNKVEKILERIEGRLGQGGPDELRWRVQAARKELSKVRKNQEMVAKLEEARLQRAAAGKGGWDSEGARQLFEKAFAWYGLDVRSGPMEEVAAQIEASPIREELVIALDEWSRSAPAERKRLRALANRADADAWRRQLRDALQQPKAERDRLVRQMADDPHVAELPLASLIFLTGALDNMDAPERAVALLSDARQRSPRDFWVNFELAGALYHVSQPGEAVRYFTAAQALRPDSVAVLTNLGSALATQKRWAEAEAVLREAIRLRPDFPQAHISLGHLLSDQKKWPEAEAEDREAVRLNPDFPQAHYNLGNFLASQKKWPEAEAAYRQAIRLNRDFTEAHYSLANLLASQKKWPEAEAVLREAIRLNPDDAYAYNNLGKLLYDQKKWPEAEAAYRQAIRLKPDEAYPHNNLANLLSDQKKWPEAEAELREAIRLKPDYSEAQYNLGLLFAAQKKWPEAEAAYRQAIRLKPDHPDPHHALGSLLASQKKWPEAEAAYRQAIRLEPDFALAHCYLGRVLGEQERYAESLAALRRGHELGSKQPGWPNPSARWVREAEQLVALDAKLPKVLSGEVQPAGAGERIALAQLCQIHKKRYAAAVRLYAAAFAEQPRLADDLGAGRRYDAACAAALAGCGQGEDAADLDDHERARLRQQALDWLRADLATWRQLFEKDPDTVRPVLVQRMRQSLADKDFAGVRGPEALARLPQLERQAWRTLWEDVAETLVGVEKTTAPEQKSGMK